MCMTIINMKDDKQGFPSDGGSGHDNGGYETEDEAESKALPWHRSFIIIIIKIIVMVIMITMITIIITMIIFMMIQRLRMSQKIITMILIIIFFKPFCKNILGPEYLIHL